MKSAILIASIYIAKSFMKIIYFFIKLFTKQQRKITMLSRQSNDINVDFRLIKKEIENINLETNKKSIEGIKVKILCKKIPDNFSGKIKYCFYIVKCMYHIATSKVCVIDGYNIAISVLNHKKNLEVVQIWHAMGAIKKFGYQVLDKEEGSNHKISKLMKMHSNYTCITCTSGETRKIYSKAFNTDLSKVKVLGMPRIDYILGKDGEIDEKVKQLLQEYPYLKRKKNILYVPTFRKGKEINVKSIIDCVDEKKYNLLLQLHPLDKTSVEDKYKVDSKYSTYELIKIADYIITDYSAVAFEAATLDKPVFFYIYDLNEYEDTRGLNINLNDEMKNCTKADISEIIKIINENLYDYSELKMFKEKYVETADTNNTKRIVDYILSNM